MLRCGRVAASFSAAAAGRRPAVGSPVWAWGGCGARGRRAGDPWKPRNPADARFANAAGGRRGCGAWSGDRRNREVRGEAAPPAHAASPPGTWAFSAPDRILTDTRLP
ncbi:hypothetical protein GCM10017687_63500 [Streptomyces echinatus]